MLGLDPTDAVGSAAAVMTLVTFARPRMLAMRMSAIAANLLFIGYGALGGFYPVAALHVVLLPLNILRLAEQGVGSGRLQGHGYGAPLIEQWQRGSR